MIVRFLYNLQFCKRKLTKESLYTKQGLHILSIVKTVIFTRFTEIESDSQVLI